MTWPWRWRWEAPVVVIVNNGPEEIRIGVGDDVGPPRGAVLGPGDSMRIKGTFRSVTLESVSGWSSVRREIGEILAETRVDPGAVAVVDGHAIENKGKGVAYIGSRFHQRP